MVLAESMRQVLNVKAGSEDLKLCTVDMKTCFKTRVVMMARKFPSFRFSSLQIFNMMKPLTVVTDGQLRWIAEQISA